MCGITAVITLAGRAASTEANDPTTDVDLADRESKKRKLTNGVLSQERPSLKSIEDELNSSLDAIDHRGPDSHGTWISPNGDVGM